MKIVATITNRSVSDSEGKGWPMPSLARNFDSNTPIEEIWTWYKNESKHYGGILEIMSLD